MRNVRRMNKAKDARRRARKHQQRTVCITTAVKVIPDARRKPAKHKIKWMADYDA